MVSAAAKVVMISVVTVWKGDLDEVGRIMRTEILELVGVRYDVQGGSTRFQSLQRHTRRTMGKAVTTWTIRTRRASRRAEGGKGWGGHSRDIIESGGISGRGQFASNRELVAIRRREGCYICMLMLLEFVSRTVRQVAVCLVCFVLWYGPVIKPATRGSCETSALEHLPRRYVRNDLRLIQN